MVVWKTIAAVRSRDHCRQSPCGADCPACQSLLGVRGIFRCRSQHGAKHLRSRSLCGFRDARFFRSMYVVREVQRQKTRSSLLLATTETTSGKQLM